jgi:hypothetical protein
VTKFDFAAALPFIDKWISAHRAALVTHSMAATVDNLNVPSCDAGSVRGEVDVPPSTDGLLAETASNCLSTATGQKADAEAFVAGFATLSRVPNAPASGG